MSTNIRRIDPETSLPDDAGGKARGLQLIAKAGLRVPPAWVVLPRASEEETRALASELQQSGQRLLAVRSSARDEDDERSSFAGVHESLLGVLPDELAGAVAKVAASALSDRARSYRQEIGLPPPSGPCAVVVQHMIPSECAGIAFGAGNGNDRVVIEAVEGLGETAVSGQAVPETLYLRRSNGGWQIERRMPRSQAIATMAGSDGVSRVTLPPERQHTNLLDDARASEIAEGVARLERLSGKPLDVEWAWASGALWFLQARPRTRPLQDKLPPGEIWTRVNARDVLPEIPSAFSRSTSGPVLDAAERTFQRKHGIRTDPAVPFFTFVYGRPVFSDRIFRIGDLLGVPRATMQAEFGGSSEADNTVKPLTLGKALRHPVVLLRAIAIAAGTERRANGFIARMGAVLSEIAAIDVQAATEKQLLDTIHQGFERVSRPWVQLAIRVTGAITNAQYPVLRRVQRHPSPRALLARLLADGEGSVSTQQLDDLLALAAAMRAWPGAAAFAQTITPEHAETHYWQDLLPVDLWHQVERWLERYGHRGPFESDIARPRYREDLRLLADALFPLVSDAAAVPDRSPERRREEAMRAWAEVEHLYGRWGRRLTARDIRRVKRLMALRERLRSEMVRAILALRGIPLELGRRLEASGRLPERADVWHLSFDQLSRAFEQPSFAVDVAVARERARRAAWRRIEVPNRFTSEEVASLPSRNLSAEAGGSTLHGNGVSPGIVEGEVRVLKSPSEAYRFITGGVLVAPATDPAWTPLFARAVGVIVELGGALSHAGIVAREYGIPCVANIDGITRMLRDGDVVRIDGSSGEVNVLSRASDPLST